MTLIPSDGKIQMGRVAEIAGVFSIGSIVSIIAIWNFLISPIKDEIRLEKQNFQTIANAQSERISSLEGRQNIIRDALSGMQSSIDRMADAVSYMREDIRDIKTLQTSSATKNEK